MAIGERFRTGGARGIARFLSDHQHCGDGFDVHREAGPGTGRLKITCKGCGESIAYKAAEAGELAAGPPVPNGGPALVEAQKPAPAQGAAKPPLRAPLRQPSRRSGDGGARSWVPLALIAALIVAGVVMIVVGLNRTGGGSEPASNPPATQPAQTAPTETAPTETTPPAQTTPPAATTPAPAPAPAPSAAPALPRRSFLGRFAMGIPPGWQVGDRDNSISVTAGGDTAELRVFLQRGESSLGDLADGAARFLAAEHDGAHISGARPLRLGDARASRVIATYGRGEEVAVVLTGGGYTFLVLRRVDNRAPEPVAVDAQSALESFRAKG